MKFGSVPLSEALGGILAHSVPLKEGRMRKGKVLGSSALDQLRNAGITEVVVAQLEDGDIEENAAASSIAEAITARDSGLRCTNAATGRVNILAECAGIAEIDAEAIEALNLIHPMITVATVAPFARMIEGGMVATVKIISYGVAEKDVTRACDMAREALGLRQAKYRTATLIQTVIGESDAAKGLSSTQKRLAALGIELTGQDVVSHDIDELSEAIRSAQGEVVLILTASATSDIRDTAPAALLAAGGEITAFGMPVDPGNLLFFGVLGNKPVIGLPGCARSPALNGADWVMERLLCGVEVSQTDIARMGVGGLLKEIASRPQPRALK
ncbi:molybdopterin-binding protein [Falsihalocynthiibacter sp. SS001]|uniref:molybdopterin-binding protein n=1 Tax=Falsihalocynthiibacter sp. SS001 TaxID=3349698 RepID=UPI0036D3FB22